MVELRKTVIPRAAPTHVCSEDAAAFWRDIARQQHASVVTFGPRQQVVQDGAKWDSVLVVLDGWLAIAKTLQEGEVQVVDFMLPGDYADPVAGDGVTSGTGVEAVTAAQVAMFPHAVWREMLRKRPDVEKLVVTMRAANRTRTYERLLRVGKASAATRITYALLELCVRLKCGTDAPCAYHIPLTQKDIGDFTGLSSVHVCRTLRRLARQEIIESDDHLDIRIVDADALSDIAQITREDLAREVVPRLA